MSFLRGFLSGAGDETTKQHDGVETIEKLCERLETAALLDDRRDAIRALRALSKNYKVEVGTHAMDMLISVIRDDSSDAEVTEMVIETLLNVMATQGDVPTEDDLGVQFTEMFIKSDDNITLLMSLLEEYDFHIRWPTVKLLILLLKNRSKELQDKVLESPMGISKLMDLLSDSREIIRNDGLLLMIQLTKNNPAIQKIVAFENAFERLLSIVAIEGYSSGGIIVEDCLSLLLNLLRNNISNQNYFRETSNIQRIAPFFEMAEEPDDSEGGEESLPVWVVQKQTNVLLMLEVLQVLVSPNNNQQSVTSTQKVMYTRGIFMQLMDLILYPNLPGDIFATLLITIGDIIRGNEIIQQFMDELELSDRKAIVLLLMFMVNDKQPFETRLAALYCVQSFLFKNPKGQANIVSTLLPNQDEVSTGMVSSGKLLCAGLFSADDVAHWLCGVTLSHCLNGNGTQRHNMLLVQLEITPGYPPVCLINQVFQMLLSVEGVSTRTLYGVMMLLSLWLEDTPQAVNSLLQIPDFIPYLLKQIEHNGNENDQLSASMCGLLLGLCLKYNNNSVTNYSKDTLLHIITQRIGVDSFRELLESASINNAFTRASKSPHPFMTVPLDMKIDYNFTKYYKRQQDIILKAIEGEDPADADNTIESHDLIVNSYKELIKQQDEEINQLKMEVNTLKQSSATEVDGPASATLDHLQQYTDQIAQLQSYIQQQEQHYTGYIAQLQTWYAQQVTAVQSQTPNNATVKSESETTYEVKSESETTENVPTTNTELLAHDGNVNERSYDELETRYTALQGKNRSLEEDIAKLVSTVEELERQVEEAKGGGDSHPVAATGGSPLPPTSTSDTPSSVTPEQIEIDKLQNSVKEQHVSIELLETEKRELQARVTELQSNRDSTVAELTTKITALEAQLLDKEALLHDQEQSIHNSNEELLRLREQLAAATKAQPETETAKKGEAGRGQGGEVVGRAESGEVQGGQGEEQTGEYLYDYSQWFTPVVADDGNTYYQSYDGHVYTEEQYRYTINQYEAYYRAQQQQQPQDQGSVEGAAAASAGAAVAAASAGTEVQGEGTTASTANLCDAANPSDTASLVEDLRNKISGLETENGELRGRVRSLTEEVLQLRSGNHRNTTATLTISGVKTEVITPTRTSACIRSPVNVINIESQDKKEPYTPDMASDDNSTTDADGDDTNSSLQVRYHQLQEEHDQFLILLSHQDKQLETLKKRLRELGDMTGGSSGTDDEDEEDYDEIIGEDLPRASQLTIDGRLVSD